MPIFEYTTKLEAPVERVFDFIVRPRNLLLVNPPKPKLELVDAPERLVQGSRMVARLRQYALTWQFLVEVTWFAEGHGFTDAQIRGPFGKWVHTHTVTATNGGTQMHDHTEYSAPKGFLGWFLTDDRIHRDLERMFAYRAERFRELLSK
jgi:ligand-binding SRPBCC domain-containing protein